MTVLCIPCSAHPCPCVGPVAGLILIDPLPVQHHQARRSWGENRESPDVDQGHRPLPGTMERTDSEIIASCRLPGLCAVAWLNDSSGPSPRSRSPGLHDLLAGQTVIQPVKIRQVGDRQLYAQCTPYARRSYASASADA